MCRTASVALGLLLLLPSLTQAQGVLIDVRPDVVVQLPRPTVVRTPQPDPPQQSYKIKELAVHATLENQVARVQVSQSFVNTGSQQMEVCFVFPLPYDGAVDQLTLLVDGKEYPARLLKAEEARQLYEEIVRKNRDPALLEWMGSGLFKTSVFPVPAGAERKVTLRYSQLCRAYQGVTDFLFPLRTARYTSHPVEKVHFQVTIRGEEELKNVYSPTHSVEIERPNEKQALVTYTTKNQVPTSDFRLLYDVGQGKLGTSVLSYRPNDAEEGFFLLLASPEIKPADGEQPKKTVVLVLDRSGSMSGEKIDQAKEAARFVLNNLREGDLFNVIAYDSQVESWRSELQRYNEENRKDALGFVAGMYAGGSTNINGALQTALGQLTDPKQPTYLLFLTDGLPTVGETGEQKIVQNAQQSNEVRARIFAFGVGYDVNSRLLDKLVRTNYGQSEYVRPDEDIEDHVSRFYERVSSPVLTRVEIEFDLEGAQAEEGEPVSRIYPKPPFDLFAGEQLVLVGRYRKAGDAKVTVTGNVGEESRSFDFPAELIDESRDDSYAFIEKLWAVRRIGEIIDEIDLKGKNDELVKELVQLATKHGVLTPYTSFLADEETRLNDLATNTERAGRRLDQLERESGEAGFAQRQAKGGYQYAPRAAPAEALAESAFQADRAIRAADPNAAAPGVLAEARDADAAQARVAQVMRQIGRKTFYQRGGRWIDAELSEAEQQQPVQVERFSPDYFRLVKKHEELGRYLTFDEPVLVEIDGQAYQF